MKSRFNKYLLSFCLMLISITVFAQAPPPPPPPGFELPIDGGLVYLIISGVIYGIYQLKSKKE